MTEEEKLRKENEHLRCALHAASVEIRAYWHAHVQGGVAPLRLLDYLEGREQITAYHNPFPQYPKGDNREP